MDFLRHLGHALAIRVQYQIGNLTIQRIANFHQFLESRPRIFGVE